MPDGFVIGATFTSYEEFNEIFRSYQTEAGVNWLIDLITSVDQITTEPVNLVSPPTPHLRPHGEVHIREMPKAPTTFSTEV